MASIKWQDSPEKSEPPVQSPSRNNPWFAISLGLMGLIVGFGIAKWRGTSLPVVPRDPSPVAQAPTPIPNPTPTPANPASVDDDPFLGEEDAPVMLIEFIDYQCPFCKRFFDQTLLQIKTEYIDTGKVKFVARDFPLGFHPNAQKASESTECAEEGGKFWAMHDLLFAKQDEWSPSSNATDLFKKYASDLDLPSSFDACLDDGKYAQEVQKDLSDGTSAGINGTPGFWVLGPDGKSQQISGAVPFANFKQAFDTLLNLP